MRRLVPALVAAVFSLVPNLAHADAPREVVVAIRYLQAEGTSHAHLYLYREDGKLLRQLTKDDVGQDFDPVFSPDGTTIVFSREIREGLVEFWSVDPLGHAAQKLDAAPDWYTQTRTSPYFQDFKQAPDAQAAADPSDATAPDPPQTYKAPDGSVEIVVQRLANDEEDSVNGEGTGKHFLLRDLKAGTETEMGKLPGFLGLWNLFGLDGDPERAFLFEGPLRLAFFGLHLNSTDGDTVFALDLTGRRLVRLSPNGAGVIRLPGQAAFLTMTYVRYVPIPGSKKTANCSYLERWDEKLNHLRYTREGTAAICYGASMFRPADTPRVITVRRDAD